MDHNELIAKILGWIIIEGDVEADTEGRWIDHEGNFVAYLDDEPRKSTSLESALNSPEGREAVRDRAEELAEQQFLGIEDTKLPDGTRYTQLLKHSSIDGAYTWFVESFQYDSQMRINIEALLWLSEREATDEQD